MAFGNSARANKYHVPDPGTIGAAWSVKHDIYWYFPQRGNLLIILSHKREFTVHKQELPFTNQQLETFSQGEVSVDLKLVERAERVFALRIEYDAAVAKLKDMFPAKDLMV